MSVKAKQLEITSPCPINLDRSAVSAQDRSMFCAHCTKDVHLLSQMTEAEARDLMKSESGRDICVSYSIRNDGSIRFRSESTLVPVTALSRRVPATKKKIEAPRRRMSLVASIGASMLLAACTPHGEPEMVGGLEAKPVVEQTSQPELIEEIPCDVVEPVPVAGGLRAEPLPEPEPELIVDGGLRAEPLPEPAPVIEEQVREPKQIRRGGIRARPLNHDPIDPLTQI